MSLETIQWQRLPDLRGKALLDLGCGEGRHSLSAWLNGAETTIGLDIGETDLRTASSRRSEFQCPSGRQLLFVRGNGMQLPFPDETFDIVVCSEVLEHLIDYKSVLIEIERVLAKGGVFAMSVPRFWPEWLCWRLSSGYHNEPGGHVRIFRSGEIRTAIESLGMKRFALHWAHALHVPYWWLKCLFWGRDNALIRGYHRFLVWDLMNSPRLTRGLERILDPIMGKSIAMYFRKEP